MRIAIPREILPGERRVAATPEGIRHLVGSGHAVAVQSGAGDGSWISDEAYAGAGAAIAADPKQLYAEAEIVLKVRVPLPEELLQIPSGTTLIGMLGPADGEGVKRIADRGIRAFSLELLPRTTRAQAMDVLSSQATIAGYKAVLIAADAYRRHFPMLMTAAGTIRPARLLVLGAGVAGLMAIATARRLGAIVEAFDVRPAVREQVQSLGAAFIDVPLTEGEAAETTGGYAREMNDDYKRRQSELIAQHVAASDIVITTAQIPGRPAPLLVSEEMVRSMRPGSVICDLAAESGGNCALSESGATAVHGGVTVIGAKDLPSLVAADASALYARNVLAFLELLLKQGEDRISLNLDDEIIAATLVCHEGRVLASR